MGVTEFPCPSCGTPQKVRAPNGVEVKPSLCAACREKETRGQPSQAELNDEADNAPRFDIAPESDKEKEHKGKKAPSH